MDAIQKNTELTMDDFNSMEDVYRYVDAIVSSGSNEEAKGCVFVLGNTSSGKSSLVQTVQKYCKDKVKTPKPFLTGDEENKSYLETRVLDIVENCFLQRNDQNRLIIRREHNEAKGGIQKTKTGKIVSKKYNTLGPPPPPLVVSFFATGWSIFLNFWSILH